jgi:hypothetical protein
MRRLVCVLLLATLPKSVVAEGKCTSEDLSKNRCITIEKTEYHVCSTEKINRGDCLVVVDRLYPVTWPTIQMRGGTKVYVALKNPLEFETVSLDWTGFSALPGTDQIASVLPLAIPQLKGFATSNVTSPPQQLALPQTAPPGPAAATLVEVEKLHDKIVMQRIQDQLKVMDSLVDTATEQLPVEATDPKSPTLYTKIRAVYEQLNQATAPPPKPGTHGGGADYTPPPHASQTPNPWKDYKDWRHVLLCELTAVTGDATTCTVGPAEADPAFVNVISDIATLQTQLPSTSSAAAPPNPLFDQTTFEALAKDIKSESSTLQLPEDQAEVKKRLDERSAMENQLLSRLTVLSNTLTNVQKDFTTYYQNILFAIDAVPSIHTDSGNKTYTLVGSISDPGSTKKIPSSYPWFLGRQVTYSVNSINDIATSQAAITPATVKTSLSTVTVLYANPHFETSAGALVSFVHNRTFANETISNAPAGSPYTDGEVVISETKTDPELVPMVAVHWRASPEFLMFSRRGALYGTIWVGLNPYSNVPEYGAGPTISWRSLMVSFLYNRAHQTSLVPPQMVNAAVCMPATGSSPPACASTPAAPVTQTTPLNAFAIGLSIRVPTSFSAGTGGVSR